MDDVIREFIAIQLVCIVLIGTNVILTMVSIVTMWMKGGSNE